MTVNEIAQRRNNVIEEMKGLHALQRGTLNEQWVERVVGGKPTEELRGPYYVLSRNVQGKTVSRRVAARDLESVRAGMKNYERFMELCKEFVELSELLREMERQEVHAGETLKKTPKSPSRKTRK